MFVMRSRIERVYKYLIGLIIPEVSHVLQREIE